MDLEKAHDHVQYCAGGSRGIWSLLLWAIQSLYYWSKSLVHIANSMSDPFPVRFGLGQACPLSTVLFITFIDRISGCCQIAAGVRIVGLSIPSLLFEDDVVLLTS